MCEPFTQITSHDAVVVYVGLVYTVDTRMDNVSQFQLI